MPNQKERALYQSKRGLKGKSINQNRKKEKGFNKKMKRKGRHNKSG